MTVRDKWDSPPQTTTPKRVEAESQRRPPPPPPPIKLQFYSWHVYDTRLQMQYNHSLYVDVPLLQPVPASRSTSRPSRLRAIRLWHLHKNELYWKGTCVSLWQSVPPIILTEIQSTSFTEPVHDYQILPLWRQDSMSGIDITLCSRTLIGKSKAATDPRLNQAIRDSSCLGLKFSQWATVYLYGRDWDRIAVVRYGSRVVSPVLSHRRWDTGTGPL